MQHPVVQALGAIREVEETTLARAVDILQERYQLLRRTRPDGFTVSVDDYGRGVHT